MEKGNTSLVPWNCNYNYTCHTQSLSPVPPAQTQRPNLHTTAAFAQNDYIGEHCPDSSHS